MFWHNTPYHSFRTRLPACRVTASMPNGKNENVVVEEFVVHHIAKASKLSPSRVAIQNGPDLGVPFNPRDADFETLDEIRSKTRASILVLPTCRVNIISCNTKEDRPSAHSSAQS